MTEESVPLSVVVNGEYRLSSSDLLRDMWQGGAEPYLADITLRVGEAYGVKGHKSVLGTRVPFFTRAFESGMREMAEGEFRFEAGEISPDCLDAIVRGLYGQVVKITPENVYHMHLAANFLLMKDLSLHCTEFMVKNLKVDTVMSSWHHSQQTFPGAEVLRAACFEFLLANFLQIYRRQDFLDSDYALMSQCVASKALTVCEENDVVDAVLTWVNQKWTQRHELVSKLLNLIQWDSVTSECHEFASVKAIRNRATTSESEDKTVWSIGKALMGRSKAGFGNVRKKAAGVYLLGKRQGGKQLYVVTGGTKPSSCRILVVDWATQSCCSPLPIEGNFLASDNIVSIISYRKHVYLLVHSESRFAPLMRDPYDLVLHELDGNGIVSFTTLVKPDPKCQYKGGQVVFNADCGLLLIESVSEKLIIYDLNQLSDKEQVSALSLEHKFLIEPALIWHPFTVTESVYAIADGKLWVITGRRQTDTDRCSTKFISDVQCFEFVRQKWSTGPAFPFCGFMPGPWRALANDKIIVILKNSRHYFALDVRIGVWHIVGEAKPVAVLDHQMYVSKWVHDAGTTRRRTMYARFTVDLDDPPWMPISALDGVEITLATFV